MEPNKDEVCGPSSDKLPDLRDLLYGRNPSIFAASEKEPQLTFLTDIPAVAAACSEFDDMLPLPEVAQTARPERPKSPVQVKKTFMRQLRDDIEFATRMIDRIDAYDSSRKVKAQVHEQKFEDDFYVPLQMRIRQRVLKGNYEKYQKDKREIIAKIDRNPVPIRSSQEPIAAPHIVVSTGGLHDPTNKFVENKRKAKEFERKIAEMTGNVIVKRKLPQRETLNYAKFQAQRETRFFDEDGEAGVMKGRRYIDGKLHATSALTFNLNQ